MHLSPHFLISSDQYRNLRTFSRRKGFFSSPRFVLATRNHSSTRTDPIVKSLHTAGQERISIADDTMIHADTPYLITGSATTLGKAGLVASRDSICLTNSYL